MEEIVERCSLFRGAMGFKADAADKREMPLRVITIYAPKCMQSKLTELCAIVGIVLLCKEIISANSYHTTIPW